VILSDAGIDNEYAPTITIESSEQLSLEMKKMLSEFLFTKLSSSYDTAYSILNIDIDDEKQKRIIENEENLDEIFKVRQTSYTSSGDVNDEGGRPNDSKDKQRQEIDNDYNKQSR
jgi:hypothetical protein